MIEIVAQEINEFYGDQNTSSLYYITNSVNSYSIAPNTLPKMEDKYGFKYTRIIVTNDNWSFMKSSIKKMFSKGKIKSFHELEEALKYSLKSNSKN